jgi:integrase
LQAATLEADEQVQWDAHETRQHIKRRHRTREPLSAYTVELMERRLEMHVFPHIGHQRVQSLSAPQVLAVLRRVEAHGSFDLAHRLRSICSRVLRYARATGRRCQDVAGDLLCVLTPTHREHMAAVTEPAAISKLLRTIEAYDGPPLTRLALRLAAYTFTRPIELRRMEWSHVDIEGPNPEWRVPWTRMKMREPHIVPLAAQCVRLLQEVRLYSGERRWVFPQERFPERPMSECCLTVALRKMGYRGTQMTWHGFRAMASTQLNELGWNDSWIETQLAHAERNKSRRVYNHAKYLPQRRAMMQAWAHYLDELRLHGASISWEQTHGQLSDLVDSFSNPYAPAQQIALQARVMDTLRSIVSLSAQALLTDGSIGGAMHGRPR